MQKHAKGPSRTVALASTSPSVDEKIEDEIDARKKSVHASLLQQRLARGPSLLRQKRSYSIRDIIN